MKSMNSDRLILAGDIGGTKTNLALYSNGRIRPVAQVIESYSSRDELNLESIVEQFFEKHPASISEACFAIAGPVMDGRCKTTNLPWNVSEQGIKRRFGWKVRLINDLAATALSIPLLHSRELHPLNTAMPRKGGNIALVAPGTGLGTSVLVWYDGKYTPIASEGGHVDFAPTDKAQALLWRHMFEHYGHVSIERIVSGMGILNIFSYLKETGKDPAPGWLARDMERMDPARAITEAAIQKKDPLCVKVLGMFTSILGSIAGNLALTVLATGGVYLGGGIPPKILPALADDVFMNAFTGKGRFKDLLEKISVQVILNDRAAILGAARCALEMVI
ncbi:Glk [Desulforapulum autotrophicum HRM2]|uniref:Glucokinase n=1 Tax=Desulforapulum autotrophicum (strain ATCC 43914 / DSM 3382 / VKM B-1955 / HRM2) TaxID=177437 RepID=C0QLL4_DESAH|nr:glucokinase [Desulforapulum autotrophicum]ACN16318.1 Glk [Desulforapulum autotrophicum HRM2]